MRKKTHEEFMKDFEEKQPELFARVEVLGEYKDAKSKIKCKCKKCGSEFQKNPDQLLHKVKICPVCDGNIVYTTETYTERLKYINPDIEAKSEYVNAKTKMLFKCKIDGYEWYAHPSKILHGNKCPKCQHHIAYDIDSFKTNLFSINKDIIVLGNWVNVDTPIKCRCNICGNIWEPRPDVLLRGGGCGKCAIKSNSQKRVYSHKEFVAEFKKKQPENFKNIEFISEYAGSHTKLKCKCLIDGFEWEITPTNLLSGRKCPKCAHSGTSWLQEQIEDYFSKDYAILSRDKSIIGMELDIVIPELKLAVEPGSWFWHYKNEDKRNRDAEKRRLCAEKGYTCITIYDACDNPELIPFRTEDTCLIYEDDIGTHKYLLDDVLDSIEDIIKTR